MICNICGNDTFELVPFRIGTPLTVQQGNKNFPPKCRKCGSVERHRIIKTVYLNNKKQSNKPLLFSKDPAIKYLPTNTEVSIYESENSINIQDIKREDESYDLIFHHHVLEHVENDELAFSELCRILKTGGQMYWSVPSPTLLEETKIDDPKKNHMGHYRWYGNDFIKTVEHWSDKYNVTTTAIYETDVVTKFKDCIFLTEKE